MNELHGKEMEHFMKPTTYLSFEEFYINYTKSTTMQNMEVQHYHNSYEIFLLINGERYLFMKDDCYTLQRGDLVILTPFHIHYTESREIKFYERYVMNFTAYSLLSLLTETESNLLLKDLKSCVIHLTEEQTALAYDYFKKAGQASKTGGFLSKKLLYTFVFQLLMMLKQLAPSQETINVQNIQPEIATAIQYINANYEKNINLEHLADFVHLSKYHFCRLFHQTTGATFLNHLNTVRLTKVHHLLLHSNDSLKEIAEKTGFSSTAHMTRIFKNTYHIAPREFLKMQRLLR